MGQIWETFWLGKFDFVDLQRDLVMYDRYGVWREKILPDECVLSWWKDLQHILFIRCQTYYVSALQVALRQCIAKNMDYDFIRRFVPFCVEKKNLTDTFIPSYPRICEVRNVRCKHLGVTVREVLDSLSFMADKEWPPPCGCPTQCRYSRSRAVAKENLNRELEECKRRLRDEKRKNQKEL